MKQFVTVLDKEFAAFKYLQDFFLKLSVAKVKACVFVSATNKEDHCARNSPRSSLGWRKQRGIDLSQKFGAYLGIQGRKLNEAC